MKNRSGSSLVLFVVIATAVLFSPGWLAAQQQFYELGDLKLESGQVMRGCVLGYRTYGRLNDARSNAVLFPTWFGGKSSEMEPLIGKGKLIDSSKYFVITVDTFGNGISSSPSNSKMQPGRSFPEFSIGDMVRAQYRLVTEKLGISRLHAVVGISMGGMQTFYWMAAYPDLMKKAVPIAGTPRLTFYDLLLLQTELNAIRTEKNGHGWERRSRDTVAGIHALASYTPDRFVSTKGPEELMSYLEDAGGDLDRHDPNDWAWQLKAVAKHDIYAALGSPHEIAGKVLAKVFIVTSARDHMVNPKPSLELAGIMKARSLNLDSNCGHFIFRCEFTKITSAVSDFLDR